MRVLIAYHEALARGGAALSILEVGSVHPTSAFCLNIFDPAIEGGMRKLVETAAPHGMKLFQQHWHADRRRARSAADYYYNRSGTAAMYPAQASASADKPEAVAALLAMSGRPRQQRKL